MKGKQTTKQQVPSGRKKQIFLMTDALLILTADGDRVLYNQLKLMDALPGGIFHYSQLATFRDNLSSDDIRYYSGNTNADMLPQIRFELTKQAVEDLDLGLYLRRMCVDKTFLSTPTGLGLAQTVAIYKNNEAEFKELCGGDARNLRGGCRRHHLLFSSLSMEWFLSRTPYLQGVIFADLCSSFFFDGAIHPLLHQFYALYEQGRVSAPWLGAEIVSMLRYWRGEEVAPEEFMTLSAGKRKPVVTAAQAFALGSQCLFRNDAEALAWCNKGLSLLKKERQMRTSVHIGQYSGLCVDLTRFLFGEYKDLEQMRENINTLSTSGVYGCDRSIVGIPGFLSLAALDWLKRGDKEAAQKSYARMPNYAGSADKNFLSALLYYLTRMRLKTGSHDDIALRGWYLAATGFPRLQRCFADMLYALPGLDDHAAWGRDGEFPDLLDLSQIVEEMPDWQLRINALESLVQDRAKATRKKRFVWVVDMSGKSVHPQEQTLGIRGWSKGRDVSLKRLYEKSGDLSAMTEVDRRIAAGIENTGWWNTSYELSLYDCYEALADCHQVYEVKDGLLEPLSFKEGTLKFSLREKNRDNYVLTVGSEEIKLPEDAGNSSVYFLRKGNVITYYKLSERDQQVVRLIGKGMAFPKTSLGRVISLTRNGLDIDVNTDGIDAETVEPVSAPVLQLEQTNSGFEALLGVRPFGRPHTPFFQAGEGAREPLASVVLDPAAEETAGAAQNKRKLTKTLRVVRDFEAETKALEELARACPTLEGNLEGNHWFTSDVEQVLALLEELPQSGQAYSVEWPKGGRLKLRGRVDAGKIKAKIGWTSNDWFGVSGEVELDDHEKLSLNALLSSLKGSRFVMLKEGEYVALTADLRRKLSSLKLVGMENKKGEFMVNSLASAAVEQALEDVELESDVKWQHSTERMHKAFATTPEVPRLLHAELRDYQREGYVWMQRLAIWGVGACLADDMGLGKTLQAIAVMLNQAQKGPCLVVAPTSVCANWELEINRFAPSLNVRRLGHTGRSETISTLESNDVLIVGYGLLYNVQKELATRTWAMVTFDEAQALKNAATKRARAGSKLQADFRLALTGTPIENRIDDLWSLFNIINPGLLGSWDTFLSRYGAAATPGSGASKALRAVVRPFLLRRLKANVLDELPEKTEQNIIVEPNAKELAFYENLRQKAVAKIHASDSCGGNRRFEILAELTRLRRACCHPGLADPDMMALEKYSTKTQTFLETVSDLIAGGHKVLAFSQFTSYLAQIREALEEHKISYQYLDGSTPETERRKRVAAFQKGEGDVFLLSLKAGGTGINLTAADYVSHLDPWWNPAVEDQASDRAHRIGQKRPVTIYRMVQAGSVEEKILSLHASKRELAADFLEGTETSVKSLTEEDLLRLLQ